MWWLHLLIRGVDTLEARAPLFERLVRALGGGRGVPYVGRAEALLLQIGHPSFGGGEPFSYYCIMMFKSLEDDEPSSAATRARIAAIAALLSVLPAAAVLA